MIVGQVAEWYQNFAVSSAHVSRKRIYPDIQSEKALSPTTKINAKKTIRPDGPYKFKENCHFGWVGHQGIVWSFAYSFLQVVVNHCQEQDTQLLYQQAETSLGPERSTFATERFQEVQQSGQDPPPLSFALHLEDVADKWREEEAEYKEHCNRTASMSSFNPCLMAWVAGPEGQTSNAGALSKYLIPYLAQDSKTPQKQGWGYQADVSHGWSRKLGLVASKNAASGGTLTFEFPRTQKPVRKLTLHSLKSYGPGWEGSIANVQLKHRATGNGNATAWTSAINQNITAFHNSVSSITYTTEFDLEGDGLPTGIDVRLELKLVAGENFKVTGMMLCNS